MTFGQVLFAVVTASAVAFLVETHKRRLAHKALRRVTITRRAKIETVVTTKVVIFLGES